MKAGGRGRGGRGRFPARGRCVVEAAAADATECSGTRLRGTEAGPGVATAVAQSAGAALPVLRFSALGPSPPQRGFDGWKEEWRREWQRHSSGGGGVWWLISVVRWPDAGGHQADVGIAGWCQPWPPAVDAGPRWAATSGLGSSATRRDKAGWRARSRACSRLRSRLPTQTACGRRAGPVSEAGHKQEHSWTPFSIYTIHERLARHANTYDPVVEKEAMPSQGEDE